MDTIATPPLQGTQSTYYDGRYRLYTVDTLPFDAVPDYADGGPATVVIGPWGMSTCSVWAPNPDPIPGERADRRYQLSIYRFNTPCDRQPVRHNLDRTTYGTSRDAARAAYNAGVLGFMVYDRDAARYGLPTEDGSE